MSAPVTLADIVRAFTSPDAEWSELDELLERAAAEFRDAERRLLVASPTSSAPKVTQPSPSEGVTPHGVQWCNRCKDGPCEGILVVHACEIRKRAVSV